MVQLGLGNGYNVNNGITKHWYNFTLVNSLQRSWSTATITPTMVHGQRLTVFTATITTVLCQRKTVLALHGYNNNVNGSRHTSNGLHTILSTRSTDILLPICHTPAQMPRSNQGQIHRILSRVFRLSSRSMPALERHQFYLALAIETQGRIHAIHSRVFQLSSRSMPALDAASVLFRFWRSKFKVGHIRSTRYGKFCDGDLIKVDVGSPATSSFNPMGQRHNKVDASIPAASHLGLFGNSKYNKVCSGLTIMSSILSLLSAYDSRQSPSRSMSAFELHQTSSSRKDVRSLSRSTASLDFSIELRQRSK